jgi:hypothetical protein
MMTMMMAAAAARILDPGPPTAPPPGAPGSRPSTTCLFLIRLIGLWWVWGGGSKEGETGGPSAMVNLSERFSAGGGGCSLRSKVPRCGRGPGWRCVESFFPLKPVKALTNPLAPPYLIYTKQATPAAKPKLYKKCRPRNRVLSTLAPRGERQTAARSIRRRHRPQVSHGGHWDSGPTSPPHSSPLCGHHAASQVRCLTVDWERGRQVSAKGPQGMLVACLLA